MESNCISVNRNGSVGYAFYHCYEALYGNDTRKLNPVIKNKYANGAKKDNNVLGLLLNMTFGINSPVNTTMIVDNTVFKRTCVTGE